MSETNDTNDDEQIGFTKKYRDGHEPEERDPHRLRECLDDDVKAQREKEREVFGKRLSRPTDRTELRAELASEGDADAAEKMAFGDGDSRGTLAKAFDEDDDVPGWAVALAEQVEQNGETLRQIRDGEEKAKAHEVFHHGP